MKFIHFVIFLAAIFIFFPSGAQFYSTGEAPSSIRWRQLSTPGFRIVYPQGLHKDAVHLATELERNSALIARPFTHPAKHMPILLHNTSVLSNGYVTWTPRRMELVTTPPQDSYAQDWIIQLALHEFRHVVQISQLRQGFTSALSIFTGEIAPGGVSALMPSWFYEGDAVMSETANSFTGRGRVAGFEMPLRTMQLEDRRMFSYSKACLGSYRDFVPNQYQYGYPIVSYGIARYGPGIWPNALNYTARHPYLLMPFVFYLGHRYNITRSRLYRQTLDTLKSLYTKTEESVTYTNYLSLNKRKRNVYTSYTLPRETGNGILALKTGIGERDHFVKIDSAGKEKSIVTPGLIMGIKADAQGNYLVWDEVRSDPRWGRRDYSEIRLIDMRSGVVRNLTKRTRYFSPDISPDGQSIAVAETGLNGNSFLSILDFKTGRVKRRIPADVNSTVQFPEWISDQKVVVITVSPLGKQIEQIDLETGKWSVIMPYTWFNISEPVHFHHYLLFRSSYNTVENIYALDMKLPQLYQVTFSRFGAYNPSVTADSGRLLFSDYTGGGFNITSIPLVPSGWKAIRAPEHPSGIWPHARAGHLAKAVPLSSEVPIDSGNYSKAGHLIHVHSWLPFYVPFTGTTDRISTLPVSAGLMIFSQNLLSTLTSTIGYHYSRGYHYLTPRIIWKGWYPVIELSGQFGGPVRNLLQPNEVNPSVKPYYELSILSYVPLVFNRGRMVSFLTPQIEYEHQSTYYFTENQLRQGLNYVHFRLYMSRFLRMSMRDLFPRWGQYLSVSGTLSPGDPDLLGSMIAFQGGLYLPGIGRHHHFLLKGGYQKQFPGRYFLPINRISFPRGYPSGVSGEMSVFSADYAFPLTYPDLAMGPVIYLKRLRTDVFHDMGYGNNVIEDAGTRYTGSYNSTGLEVVADFHLGKIVFPISAGIRIGYRYDRSRLFTEFLLNIQNNIL